jgi:hypothetical protein
MTSRRRLLQRVAGLASTAGLAGCTSLTASSSNGRFGLEPNPHDLPERQHGQDAFMRRDGDGNALVPRHHAVLLLDLTTDPSAEAARTVERAMRHVESAYEWRSGGLFHMLAWGHPYFERIGRLGEAPIVPPEDNSRIDEPRLEGFDAALVLSSDVPSHLRKVETAMFGERSALQGVPIDDRLGEVFTVTERRTGFIGEGLPQRHTDAEGIPAGVEIPESSPLFMGFRSGLTGTQATEEAVTISGGWFDSEFAGGTTMNLTRFDQSLSGWYEGLSQADRVDRMFSPEFSPEAVESFAQSVPFADEVQEHAAENGVVGHHEKVAQARADGKPLLLRRDFNTVDGGRAGVHFLSLQASIDDFVKTRRAMNGWYVRDDNAAITDQNNNGILEVITEVSVANFYVPPRPTRAFPGFRA